VTAVRNDHDVKMSRIRRRATIAGTTVGLAVGLAGSGYAADPTAGFPAGWTHLQINVVGPRGRAHTEIFDRGRVQSVTTSSVTLRENDANIVTIQISPNAVVMVDGHSGSFAQIGPRFWVRTLGIDGLPAMRVTAMSPPPPRPRLARSTFRAGAATNR
jgi:hypothetical protein